jgi:hypothetical protein
VPQSAENHVGRLSFGEVGHSFDDNDRELVADGLPPTTNDARYSEGFARPCCSQGRQTFGEQEADDVLGGISVAGCDDEEDELHGCRARQFDEGDVEQLEQQP